MRLRFGNLDWASVASIAFVVLVATDALVLVNSLDSHKSKAEFASYYGHFRGSSHEWREVLAPAVGVVAAFCFAWFLRRLIALIRPVDEGLAALVLGGGILFLALLLAALVTASAVGTTLAYSDDYRVDLDTAILVSDIALFLYTVATAGAAIMVCAVSLAARRGRLLPQWLVWGGFVVALACLATTALDGASLILLLAWILVVSVLIGRGGRPRAVGHEAGAATDSTSAGG